MAHNHKTYVLHHYSAGRVLQDKGPYSYYLRVKGWVGGISKYLLFLTGVGGWFWIILTYKKKKGGVTLM